MRILGPVRTPKYDFWSDPCKQEWFTSRTTASQICFRPLNQKISNLIRVLTQLTKVVVLALFASDTKAESNTIQAIEEVLNNSSTAQVDRTRRPPIFNSSPPGPPPPPVS